MSAPLEYEVDGTDLENAYRWITSDASGALGLPTVRGDDLVYPGVAGETPMPRVLGVSYDEFVIRVTGLNTDGTTPADEIPQFYENLRTTRQLLHTTATTLSVLKRVFYASGSVEYGPSDARCVGFTPRLEGPACAAVLIRLKVYDGWGGVL